MRTFPMAWLVWSAAVLLLPGDSLQQSHKSFNGEPLSKKWRSSLQPRYCGIETIETTSGNVTDQGTYGCTVTSSNGTSITVSMEMTMEKNIVHREKPMALKRSPDVLAQVGSTVSFTCEGYVGANHSYEASIFWDKYFFNHSVHTFVNMLANVSVKLTFGSGGSWGMIKSELVISPVQEEHFGIYQCNIRNKYATEALNMTLTNGVPEWQVREMRYRITVTAVAALLGLLAVSVMVWCRWGRRLALCCRHKLASSDNYQYDVFLVHGESVGRWVWSVLLPTLEDSYGYTCFLPQRDMSGGEMVAESVLKAMSRCRRVVVVVTPCLLDSPWATWATYSGIQSALTSRARILALVHKENNFVSDSLERNPFLNVLKVVRNIRMPEELVWDAWEGVAPLHYPSVPVKKTDVHMTDLETDLQKNALKLTIPEINISTSMSNSPRSQRLSNMITGSNAASKEDLGFEDKKTEVSGSVMFMGTDHELPDPGSPNSVTPFIILSNYDACRPNYDGMMCQPVGRCFQMLCVGNPEEKFWQTLRLHLGPPSLSRGARNTS
ncbi:interleukin-1 receptor accessory protein-like 1-A isoform X2 [Eriocheir sinensis]|uniref:interleukin-1 receptor accessory protein-like 1-A isoform X2 n=1 Tax=Eriocheir sinensis TaxID=95602 RepID=UPI0021CA42D3|nr:interleukin-1 receptor accessory protein-like 1-A isoform X2 [Eriocheir sinensis]